MANSLPSSLPAKPSPSKKPRPDPSSTQNNLLKRAISQSSRPPSSTPKGPKKDRASSSTTTATATPAATPLSSFEQQEDFISFSYSDDDSPSGSGSGPSSSRSTPRGSGRSTPKKRKLDEFEERREEGSEALKKREKGRSTPWLDEPGVDWGRWENAISMLNAETRAFITYISPTPIEHELRLWTIELIRRTIKKKWKDCEVECFGSVGTGLYLPGGDIDLVLVSPSLPSPPSKPSSTLLHHLASLLLRSNLVDPSSLLVIAKARVPIVKFVTKYGRFNVDLSVNQVGGVQAAMRVREMLEKYSFRRQGEGESYEKGKGKVKEKEKDDGEVKKEGDMGVARALVMLTKQFLNQRGMNEVFTGGLGSYSIICLVVSFLQLHPKIQTSQIHPSHNVGLLFVEFLEYYGRHFNYNECGISLRGEGKYFNKHDKGWWRGNNPGLLSIEDPNDPTNDVSGGSHNMPRVRSTLAGAYELLTATLLERQSHFAASASSQSHTNGNTTVIPLVADALPNADTNSASPLSKSILGAVIGITRDGLKGREENIRLHEGGVLQDLLAKTPGGSGAGGGGEGEGKKERQRQRKKEKEEAQRQKTIARLEKNRIVKEERQERKRMKKEGLERSLAPLASTSTSREISPALATNPISAADQIAKRIFGNDEKDDDIDSRYSISDSNAGKKSAQSKSTKSFLSFVGARGDSDSSSDDDGGGEEENDGGKKGRYYDEEDGLDDDVVVGGHGGDQLHGSRVPSNFADSSDEEVVQSLVVNSKKKAPGPAGAQERSIRDIQRATLEREKEARKKKQQEKMEFWKEKGQKEMEGGEDDVIFLD